MLSALVNIFTIYKLNMLLRITHVLLKYFIYKKKFRRKNFIANLFGLVSLNRKNKYYFCVQVLLKETFLILKKTELNS